jgi:hypothetical protein
VHMPDNLDFLPTTVPGGVSMRYSHGAGQGRRGSPLLLQMRSHMSTLKCADANWPLNVEKRSRTCADTGSTIRRKIESDCLEARPEVRDDFVH